MHRLGEPVFHGCVNSPDASGIRQGLLPFRFNQGGKGSRILEVGHRFYPGKLPPITRWRSLKKEALNLTFTALKEVGSLVNALLEPGGVLQGGPLPANFAGEVAPLLPLDGS